MANKFTSFRPRVEALEDRIVPHLKLIIYNGVASQPDLRSTSQGVIFHFVDPVDPGRAKDVTNYTLEGSDGRGFRALKVRRVWYDEASQQVALAFRQPASMGKILRARLTVNGDPPSGVVGLDGQLLDLDHDGQPGGDARASANFNPSKALQIKTSPLGQVRLTIR